MKVKERIFSQSSPEIVRKRRQNNCGKEGGKHQGPLIELMDFSYNAHQPVKLERSVSRGEVAEGKPYIKPRMCLQMQKP